MDFFDIFFHRTNELAAAFVRVLPQLGIALLVVVVTMVVAKTARRLLARVLQQGDVQETLINLFEAVLGVIIWTAGLLIAATIFFPGVTPANLFALLGLGSVAVGFAFKDIFENFLAGILIMLRKKVNVGDVIECEAVEGRMEQITSYSVSGPHQCGLLSFALARRPGKLRCKRVSEESSPSPSPKPADVFPVEPPKSNAPLSTGWSVVCSSRVLG